MAMSTPIKYPLDLTGQSPDNLVIGEPHTIGATGNRAIVLNHGPFYTRGLVVRKASDGLVITPRIHYKAAQLFPEATIKTGQEICTVIVVDDVSVGTDFLIDYQVLGGDYSASVEAITNLIDTLDLDQRPVRWGSILGKPEYFPPTPHLHDLGDLYGFEYVVASIEGVRQAILLGDVYKDQEIYDYIDRQDTLLRSQIINAETDINKHIADLDNPHQVTKAQLGLGSVENYPPATDAQAKAGASNVTYMTPLRTKAAVDVHAMRTDNPHNVTKAQVGLSLVSNYAVASLSEALVGEATNKYVTPFLVKAMIDKAFDEQVPPEPPYVAPTPKYTTSGSTNVNHDQDHSITFTDQSTAGSELITAWLWNFGDGSTYNGQSPPVHVYDSAGTYNTSLKVTDAEANERTYAIQLVLTKNAPPPEPATVDFTWTGDATVIDPNNPIIDFAPSVTAGSGAITSYLWEFDVQNVASGAGAGARTSTAANPTQHTYAPPVGAAVTVTVRLTVKDANGLSASRTKTLSVRKSAANVPPTASFSRAGATSVTSPANHSITFTDQSDRGTGTLTTWAWDFGDGTTFNGQNPPAHAYNIAVGSKTYTVKLTVTDSNGLSDTFQSNLSLTKNPAPIDPPVASFSTNGATTVLEGTNHSIGVSDSSVNGTGTITSWRWDWGDGSSASTGRTPAKHTYLVAAGTSKTFTITLTVTDSNGKSDSYTRNVTLTKTALVSPTAGLTFTGATTVTEPSNHVINFNDASTAGTGAINSWVWSFGDGSSYSGQNPPSHTYKPPVGTTRYTVKLTVTDVYGRSDSITQYVTLTKNRFTLAALSNLNFDSGDTMWTKNNAIITTSGAAAQTGSWRARVTNPSGAGVYNDMSGVVLNQGGKPVTAGDYITTHGWIRPSSGSSGRGDNVVGGARLIWLDYWGNVIGNVAGNKIEMAYYNNQWKLSKASGYAPSGAYYATAQGDCFVRWGGAYVEFDSFAVYDDTPPSGGNPGSGSCVAIEMWLDEDQQAGDVTAGEYIDGATYNPDGIESMMVQYNETSLQPTFRMVTTSGIALVASETTPFTLRDGSSKWMPDMLGEEVLVDDDGELRWEIVQACYPAGMRMVAKISINNHSYFAGEVPTRRIASHNVLKNSEPGTGTVIQ